MRAILVSMLVVIAFVVVMKSDRVAIVLPIGIGLITGLIWSLVEIQRSLHIDNRTKRSSWFVILGIVFIAVKIMQVLTWL